MRGRVGQPRNQRQELGEATRPAVGQNGWGHQRIQGELLKLGGPDPEEQLRMASEVLWGRQCLGAP